MYLSLSLLGILNYMFPVQPQCCTESQVARPRHAIQFGFTDDRQALISSANPILIRYGSQPSPSFILLLIAIRITRMETRERGEAKTALFWQLSLSEVDPESGTLASNQPLAVPFLKRAVTSLH